MQGIGGTKGAQNFEWDDIQIRTQIVYLYVLHSYPLPSSQAYPCSSLGSPEQQAQWNDTALGRTAFAEQLFKRTVYSGGRPAGGINLRDNLRRNDTSQTPLEFIYEAADCRMFYTAPMINDVTMVWKGVVDRMFRNGTAQCVQGSTGDPSSISGGGQVKGGSVPPPLPPNQGAELSNAGTAWRAGGRTGWLAVATVMMGMLYV